jgi:hypothetical protein
MSFTGWAAFPELLGGLTAAHPHWGSTRDFAEFDSVIRDKCPELVDGTGGWAQLHNQLRESGENLDTFVEELRQRVPVVSEPDPHAQQLDPESGRWRRWHAEDGEYEHYSEDDGVWERARDGRWHRYHEAAGQWLPYDGPSQTWLYRNAWLSYAEVTQPPAAPAEEHGDTDLGAVAEQLVAEALAELDGEPLTEAERAEAVATVRSRLMEDTDE